jgi:IclR family transcriptional regulator, KDG regulon repressor
MNSSLSAGAESEVSAGVKSARRVLDVIEFLADRKSGASFTLLSEELNLPKSSLHSLLLTLSARGWIHLDESSRQYRLGFRVWQVAQNFDGLDSLARIAHKHLEAASEELNETVQLAVLDGIDNVYVAKAEADHPLQLVSHVGARLPAYATGLGKVLLADLEPAELRKRMAGTVIQQFTDQTISSVDVLEQRLAEIRERGFGEDEGEYTPGVYCVAVPIRAPGGRTIAAISCSIPSARMIGNGEDRDRLLLPLTMHAAALSRDFFRIDAA